MSKITKADFEQIARENMQQLYAHAAVMTASKQDAEDAAEEAIYRLLVRTKPFESREHIKAWLIRVTVNAALKIRSRQKRQARFSGDIESAELSVDFSYPEQSEVTGAVMQLEEKSRAVILLFYYDGYSVKEIARLLKISPSAVTSRLSRAREKLKEILKGDYLYE